MHAFEQATKPRPSASRLPAPTAAARAASAEGFEQEAERVAGQVMASPGSHLACACGGGCPRCRGAVAKGTGSLPAGALPPALRAVTASAGEPMEPSTRRFMESRFGHDFSTVRIHQGPRAAEAAAALQARAFTVGERIVFGAQQYAPRSRAGRRLLAHELTHTLQQRRDPRAGAVVQRFPTGPQVLGGAAGEAVSLVTPDINIIPDILDYATIALGLTLGRALTAAERGILQPVYGPHLNYSLIRICENAACSPDGVPRTVGNLIAAPASGVSNSTLVHEAAHVWQHQNGIRYGYIPAALLSQFGAWLLTGSRNAAYNWQMYYNNHIPWMAWNPEAQAAYIEHHMALPPWYVWGTGGFLPVP